MRNRRVSGPLPSYFNETFPLARHRHPDDDEAREKGKLSWRERTNDRFVENVREQVIMIIGIFLFSLDNHSSRDIYD